MYKNTKKAREKQKLRIKVFVFRTILVISQINKKTNIYHSSKLYGITRKSYRCIGGT
ncbi:hypothetical protein GCM10019997_12200 [Prevotella corporis]